MATVGSRWGWPVAVVVVAALAGGGGWWAGRVVTSPAASSVVVRSDAFVLAQVTQASVGRSLPLSVTVAQPVRAAARNALSGVVTAVNPGQRRSGDVVYSVAGVPVRVVAGTVPFYRDLVIEARGVDVRQLENALVASEVLSSADDYYGSETVRAVKAWQKATGQPLTGSMPLGQLVAVPVLPAVVGVGEDIVLGNVLAGGEESVLAPAGQRTFELEVSAEQAKLIPEGSTVNVMFGKQVWPAILAGSRMDANSNHTVLTLTAPNGGSVCGDSCAALPSQASTQLRSEVVVVPKVSGPSVPAAAVRTDASGAASVVDESGTERKVTVKGSAQGVVVVDGLTIGTKVRVPADPAAG